MQAVFDAHEPPAAPAAGGERSGLVGTRGEDDDLLRAPTYGMTDGDEVGEIEETDDGGISDSDRVVRIWVDNGRLDRVRVSPVWYQKLDRGEGLDSRFREAIALSRLPQMDLSGLEPTPPPGALERLAELPDEVRDAVDRLPELSMDLVAAISAVADDLNEALSASISADQENWIASARRSVGRSQGVSVTVDEWGWIDDVSFDEQWLDEAQVGSIVTHVQLAAHRAHEAYRPVEPTGDTQDLLQQQELLSTLMVALLNPREDKS